MVLSIINNFHSKKIKVSQIETRDSGVEVSGAEDNRAEDNRVEGSAEKGGGCGRGSFSNKGCLHESGLSYDSLKTRS